MPEFRAIIYEAGGVHVLQTEIVRTLAGAVGVRNAMCDLGMISSDAGAFITQGHGLQEDSLAAGTLSALSEVSDRTQTR